VPNGDAVTALEESIKCVEAAMRILDGAELTGMFSVKQNGIMVVLRSCLRRLKGLCAEVGAE
jgi:hypothetical protein